MARGHSLLLGLLPGLLAGCGVLGGQDTLPDGFARKDSPGAADPTAATASNLLDEFATPAPSYRLGPGDKLTLRVWGREEISGPHTIGPDGKISVPIAGGLACTDLTREQVEEAITKALDKYYRAVAVTVSVDEYASNRISVLGSVRQPGNFSFATRPTLLSALSQAGGLSDAKTGVSSPRCSVIRGRDQIVWIDLGELLWRGNVSLNIPLQREDVVYVPDGAGVTVYVLGEVAHPGAFGLTPGMGLLDAVAVAGGLTEDALADGIRVLRSTPSGRADVDFTELMAGNVELDAGLQDGDIVYVPTRKLETWNYFWRKINPFAGLFQVTGK